ncbi:MAG: GNAT family N-acetyltransferase, partial [Brevinema sp.]
MMEQVQYRNLTKQDYPRIKELVCEAFSFDTFIKCPKTLDNLLNLYLQSCILESAWGTVAVKDGTVIGFIMGKAHADKKTLARLCNRVSFLISSLKVVVADEESKRAMKEFFELAQIYKELIKGRKPFYQGYIKLFIVSKDSRGLGVGKKLLSYQLDYMNKMNVRSLYLYTD